MKKSIIVGRGEILVGGDNGTSKGALVYKIKRGRVDLFKDGTDITVVVPDKDLKTLDALKQRKKYLNFVSGDDLTLSVQDGGQRPVRIKAFKPVRVKSQNVTIVSVEE